VQQQQKQLPHQPQQHQLDWGEEPLLQRAGTSAPFVPLLMPFLAGGYYHRALLVNNKNPLIMHQYALFLLERGDLTRAGTFCQSQLLCC
jgi:hypothetical protein